jgi:ABC-type branched-subunit amino acid transport system substrate-binding protein
MRRLLVAAALCFSLTAEAAKRPTPDLVDDALAFAETDRDKAARLLEDAIANEPGLKPAEKAALKVHAGEQRRLMGDDQAALAWFREVAQQKDDGGWRPAAQLGIAIIEAKSGMDPKLASRLEDASDREGLSTQNADKYLLLAQEAKRRNDAPGVKEYSKKALSWSKEDEGVKERVKSGVAVLTTAEAEVAAEPGKGPLEKAWAAWDSGRPDDARRLAEQVIHGGGSDEEVLSAQYLVRRVDAGVATNPQTIGVLLPLSGKFEAAGKQLKQALELGYGSASAKRKLVFVDQGETVESAVAALEKLVLEQGAVAVVGPLRTEGSLEVAKAANALHVPLVSMSQAVDLPDGRDWVLQAMVTPEDQVSALLSYAMGTRGMKEFAIFAPDNPYGRTAAEVFEREVIARGGTITVKGFYDPEANDVIPFAKALGRKDYDARKAELYKLREETKKNGGDPTKVVLPPIVDFDALFLPDNVSRIPIACAGLAYEEFPIGEFKPTKDSRTVPLLGLSGWNNETIVTRGGAYVRGGVFTDVYHSALTGAPAFEEKYRAETGRGPSALEAVAYDVGKLLAGAASTDASTAAAFREALLAAQAEGAVTGTTGFDGTTRTARHSVRILTVTAKAIAPVETGTP